MTTIGSLQKFLTSAHVAPEVFAVRPDYRVLLLAISGIKPNLVNDSDSEKYLLAAEAHARESLNRRPVNEIPHVAAWRDAYKAFGAKPAKFRNSLEALTRRVGPESGLPRVNPLTDIYNGISVKHQIPLGGEDIDQYVGSPRLIRATGKEEFWTIAGGEPIMEHPDVGEVIWCDDKDVTCRRWNWRQGTRTALTEKTMSVVFILDALRPFFGRDSRTRC